MLMHLPCIKNKNPASFEAGLVTFLKDLLFDELNRSNSVA